jgi:hypothetical protein
MGPPGLLPWRCGPQNTIGLDLGKQSNMSRGERLREHTGHDALAPATKPHEQVLPAGERTYLSTLRRWLVCSESN